MSRATVFQGAQEFDRYEGRMRRTYLLVADEMVFLANMDELPRVGPDDIQRSTTCWAAAAAGAVGDTEAALQFSRGEHTMRLLVWLDAGGVRITDPRQDEWGGFGGWYEPVPE